MMNCVVKPYHEGYYNLLEKKIMLGYTAKLVKRYGYRTARVIDHTFSLDYNRNDSIDTFHEELAALWGHHAADNHECYEVKTESGTIYFQFSDWRMYVGTGITVANW